MEDLKAQYKQTRCALSHKYETLKSLREEKKNKQLQLMSKLTLITTWDREDLEAEIARLELEMKQLNEMLADVGYVIEWLESGRRPGNKRGVERLAAYQREKPVDPLKLQAYVAGTAAGGAVQAHRVTDVERDRIELALGTLSPRERECFVMVRGDQFSFGETASLLGLKKGSVQWFVEAAAKKLRNHISSS